MTYMEESMMFERAYGAIIGIANYVRDRRREVESTESNPKTDCYDLILADLVALKETYRKKSDEAFKLHKLVTSEKADPHGAQLLANAVVLSAVEDYQEALSTHRDGARGVRKAIRTFADKEAGFYTTADLTAVLARIDKAYKEFVNIATEHLPGIESITKALGRRGHNAEEYAEQDNPYRCPLDGGGLYIRRRNKESGAVTVGCTHCNLTVEI